MTKLLHDLTEPLLQSILWDEKEIQIVVTGAGKVVHHSPSAEATFQWSLLPESTLFELLGEAGSEWKECLLGLGSGELEGFQRMNFSWPGGEKVRHFEGTLHRLEEEDLYFFRIREIAERFGLGDDSTIRQQARDLVESLNHELRTPLTRMVGLAAMIADAAPEVGELSRKIKENGLRLAATLESIQKAARLEDQEEGSNLVARVVELLESHGKRMGMKIIDSQTGPKTPCSEIDARAQVLVVEDDPGIQTILKHVLRKTFSVTVVGDGETALKVAADQEFDLVLMDIGLPRMDGVEALRHLREMPAYENVPIVAISGYTSAAERERFCARGFDEFIAKPFEPEGLVGRLEALLEGVNQPQ
jgi:CheY-like chemotaxis protein